MPGEDSKKPKVLECEECGDTYHTKARRKKKKGICPSCRPPREWICNECGNRNKYDDNKARSSGPSMCEWCKTSFFNLISFGSKENLSYYNTLITTKTNNH